MVGRDPSNYKSNNVGNTKSESVLIHVVTSQDHVLMVGINCCLLDRLPTFRVLELNGFGRESAPRERQKKQTSQCCPKKMETEKSERRLQARVS